MIRQKASILRYHGYKMIVLRGMLVTVLLVGLWDIIVRWSGVPAYIFPAPWLVAQTFYQQFGLIVDHAQTTIAETLLGFFIGSSLGALFAISLTSRMVSFLLLPVLIISQAIPTFTIAPLLMTWLGYGMVSKIATAALVIFFPVTAAFYDGLRKTRKIWLDLAHTMRASRWHVLWHIQIPAALPALASGLRIAAAFAPIGAIVGEWVGSSHGLGFLMLNANARLQIPMVFACLLAVIALSLLLYFGVDKLLNKLIWSDA